MATRNRKKGVGQLGAKNAPDTTERLAPVPSILDGRSWDIRDSPDTGTAWIQRAEGEGRMMVPTGPEAAERRIRLHEMGHVRWTPTVGPTDLPPGVTWGTFNAVEDCRIHQRLDEIGYGNEMLARLPVDWEDYASDMRRDAGRIEKGEEPKWNPLEVARMTAATYGVPEYEQWTQVAAEGGYGHIAPMVEEILKRQGLTGRRPAFKKTLATALEIDDTFGKMPSPSPSNIRLSRNYAGNEEPGTWGDMETIEMPLRIPLPRDMKSRRNRATDAGTTPRNWHRLPVDSRVFNRKRKRPAGGTVLLDQSGSMGLDIRQVVYLMSLYPAVTIATYAGTGDEGQLRIIARNGKRADDHHCYHPLGGNIVDGPALEWLATQSEPRIWISDGVVTGKGECQNLSLLQDVDRITRKGRIIQVGDMASLLPERDDDSASDDDDDSGDGCNCDDCRRERGELDDEEEDE